MVSTYISFFSQIYHLLAYSIDNTKMQLESGMFIISIDVDVGSRKLGEINKGKNDATVSRIRALSEHKLGQIDELALPLFVEIFNDFEIPATFAIRGQLTEVDDMIPDFLCKSSIKHDIGAHGYYHRAFINLSSDEAEKELSMISAGMKKFGIKPRSFVFPRNRVAHLDLLEKYEYKCFRGRGDFLHDSMYIERKGQLYNVHPSLYVDKGANYVFLKKILDMSIINKLPFHMWFHLWDFGEEEKSIRKTVSSIFVPLFRYAREKEKNGKLTFETMLSATKKVEKVF